MKKNISLDTFNNDFSKIELEFKSLFNTFDEVKSLIEDTEKKSTDFLALKEAFNEKKAVLESFKDKKYYIAFIGPYSVGKSTFINALLNRDILPEKLEIATTAFPTYLIHAEGDEKAEIYYTDMQQRLELKNFYIGQILNNVKSSYIKDIKLDELNIDDLKETLEKIEEDLKNNSEPYHSKIFSPVYSLIDKWGEKIGKIEQMSVDSVKDFVETNEDSIIIDQAKVFLQTSILSAKNDIVLVDLPGVDADNSRHYLITENFTINSARAHAYIVVTSPDKIDTKTTNEFLRLLGQKNKQISNAFWVINKSDQSNDVQETKKSLIKKISESAISINNERVYTISALKYKEKGDEDRSDYKEVISSVDELRKNLISYLSDNFVNEFIDTKLEELNKLKLFLLNFVKPKIGKYIDLHEKEAEILYEIEYIEQKVSDYTESLSERVKVVFQTIEEKLKSLDFFNSDIISSLKNRVENELRELESKNKYLEIDAERDSNIQRPEHFIRSVESKIKLNEYIREAFASALHNDGEIAVLLKIPSTLMNEDFLKNELYSLLDNESLGSRFNGVCDIILIGYSNIFNNVLELTLDNSVNQNRAIIIINRPNKLYDKINYPTTKEGLTTYSAILKDLIINKNTEDFKFIKILEQMGLEDKEMTNKDFSHYKSKLVLLIVENYVTNIKNNSNNYLKLCLNNHFKELYSKIKHLIKDKAFENKLRLHFRLQLIQNQSLSEIVKDKRLRYISIYNNLIKH